VIYPWIYPVKRLAVNGRAGEWCRLPYPGHKKGCPKFNDDPGCPPKQWHVGRHFDLEKPLYLVHSEFDLEGDIIRRRELRLEAGKKPLSARQARCVLYWQETSRKQLRDRVRLAMYTFDCSQVAFCPEGMGVNVYATARISGLRLEKIRHLKTCRHVALIGTRKVTEKLPGNNGVK
jgi:hypothetical protein